MSIRRVLDPGILTAAALALAAAGCGNGSLSGSTSAEGTTSPAALTRCEVGSSVVRHVPEAPEGWTSGPRPAIALTCSGDGVDPGAAIVGYGVPGGGSCVSAYSARLREAFGELCELPGSAWTIQCEGRGCVHYFRHSQNATILDGPAAAAAAGIEVVVDGKPLPEGAMHAAVRGKLMRSIGAEEPFDFFAAYIPRCVEPNEVEVKLLAADGSVLGIADEWDVSVPSCRRPE